MKPLGVRAVFLGREARVAIAAAILIALGAIAIDNGAIVSGVTLFVIAAAVVAGFVGLVVRPARIARAGTLTIRLAGSLREDMARSPLDYLTGRLFPTLNDLRRALEAAAREPELAGLIIELGGLEAGLATAQELHELVGAVARSGKRVVAVMAGDAANLREYMVACGASEILVNPDTALMMHGVAAGGVFLKNALEKLKISAQTLQWKEYKGAAEVFTRETMSPELRESLEAMVGDWQAIAAGTIATARRLPLERARELAGAGFLSARAAVEAGLADRIGYVEEIRKEVDPDGKDRKLISLSRYLRHVAYVEARRRRPRIALIHGLGPVIAGEPPPSGDFLSGEMTAAALRRAAIDPRIRAIVFRVNSPGGSAVGSDLVWRAVREAQARGKPVVVSMGDVAGSGGYYVAMGADAIVAEPATVTGSIGVIYTKFNLGKLLAALGINLEFAKSSEISDVLSPSRAMSEAELRQLDSLAGELYGNFTAKVAEGRKLSPSDAEALARGRVWSGVAAQARGLVDELGGLGRAVEIARQRAGIPSGQPHQLVPVPRPRLLLGMRLVLMPAETPWEAALLAHALGIPARWVPAMLRLLSRGGAMMLAPWFEP